MMKRGRYNDASKIIYKIIVSVILFGTAAPIAYAQIESPDREHIFTEDMKPEAQRKSKETSEILKAEPPVTQDLSFKAPQVEYLKEQNLIKGRGGVLLSKGGVQAQADQGEVNSETKDSKLEGNVIITTPETNIGAETATFNLDSETGEFNSADLTLEEGAYRVRADKALKLSDTKYELFDCSLTTCHCPDEYTPWSIRSKEAHITQESYAHTYSTDIELFQIPVFYSPYFAFPVKQERQSGLLVPEFGYDNKDGFQARLPLFVVLDDHTDITLAPFTQTKTRTGTGFDFRKAFSRYNNLSSRIVYSDESARGDSLRGTVTDNLSDPTFDENRFGGFYKHSWRSEPEADLQWAMLADIHLVSDDLFLREMDDREIGERTLQYTTSRVAARANIGDYVTTELLSEYNQALITDDDLVLQRLPELNVSELRSFRPFGFNPYGVKLITKGRFLATDFVRDEGFDGWREDINPGLGVPFHYQNYVNGLFGVSLNQTYYSLRDDTVPGTDTTLKDDNDRRVYTFGYTMKTGVERVYELAPGNWLTALTSLGARNQSDQLVRVKHTIEPLFNYTYIPGTDQDDLPFYDALDRIRQKSLFTYGLRTRLLGRFLPVGGTTAEPITELTPRLEDLPTLAPSPLLAADSDFDDPFAGGANVAVRNGEVRELLSLGVRQSYDYIEDHKDRDPVLDPWSDIGTDLTLIPSSSFALKLEGNYDTDIYHYTSWGLSSHFRDDRGDALRARFTYIERSLSQIEGNIEAALSERWKVGYYARYDDREHEFIDREGILRLASACNCWHFDVGLTDRTNPDRRRVMFSFTFAGLGDLTEQFGYGKKNQ